MKHLELIFLTGMMTLLFSLTTHAMDRETMSKVLGSKVVASYSAKMQELGYPVLKKMELKEIYRCMGCFLYEVTYQNMDPSGPVIEKTVGIETMLITTPNGSASAPDLVIRIKE